MLTNSVTNHPDPYNLGVTSIWHNKSKKKSQKKSERRLKMFIHDITTHGRAPSHILWRGPTELPYATAVCAFWLHAYAARKHAPYVS